MTTARRKKIFRVVASMYVEPGHLLDARLRGWLRLIARCLYKLSAPGEMNNGEQKLSQNRAPQAR
jgi:hypothetical protein